jgi:large subunit ribosomal protein L13
MKGQTKMTTREEALAERRWYLVDARGQIVGRLATAVANLLRGKGKKNFTPHVDCGDFVVVVNVEGLRFTGQKASSKLYYRHSGYPGGIRTETAEKLIEQRPDRVLREAVVGMLPKNRLGRQLATKLKIYRGADHPHAAQQPLAFTLGSK